MYRCPSPSCRLELNPRHSSVGLRWRCVPCVGTATKDRGPALDTSGPIVERVGEVWRFDDGRLCLRSVAAVADRGVSEGTPTAAAVIERPACAHLDHRPALLVERVEPLRCLGRRRRTHHLDPLQQWAALNGGRGEWSDGGLHLREPRVKPVTRGPRPAVEWKSAGCVVGGGHSTEFSSNVGVDSDGAGDSSGAPGPGRLRPEMFVEEPLCREPCFF